MPVGLNLGAERARLKTTYEINLINHALKSKLLLIVVAACLAIGVGTVVSAAGENGAEIRSRKSVNAHQQGCIAYLWATSAHSSLSSTRKEILKHIDGETRPSHITTPLMVAVALNDHGEVERLIESGADVNETNEAGCTALIWAVLLEDKTTVDKLLDAGAHGQPAFQVAVRANSVSMVKALVDARAEKTKEKRAAAAAAEIDRLRADGIRADRIVVCSDLDHFGAAGIEEFVRRVIRPAKLPIIIDGGAEQSAFDEAESAIYIFAGKQMQSRQALDCMRSFPEQEEPIATILSAVGNELGRKPDFYEDLPLGHLMGPSMTRTNYIRGDKYEIIIHLTQVGDDNYASKEALIALFGLPPDYCSVSNTCDFIGGLSDVSPN